MTSAPLGAAVTAALIFEIAREMRGSVPAPRGAPFYGLDVDIGCSPEVCESLGDQGIFRKYESVLLLGCTGGGVARWLSARLGCQVACLAPDPLRLATAALLEQRAGAAGRVSFAAARSAALPVRTAAFTHVWMLGRDLGSDPAVVGEAFRAVRPGGAVAVQLLDAAAADPVLEVLSTVGFVAITGRTVETIELPTAFVAARRRMRSRVEARWGCEVGRRWDDCEQAPPRLFQAHARRPS